MSEDVFIKEVADVAVAEKVSAITDKQSVYTFICAKCGDEFSETDGGICCFCKKPFCLSHLLIVETG